MKKLLIPIFCLLASIVHGQKSSIPPPDYGIKCGIWFDYDAAGNRIKRYYDCKDPSIEQPPGDHDLGDHPYGLMAQGGNAGDSAKGKGITLPVSDFPNGQVVMVYPNPITDQYNIRIPKATGQTHFHVYDAKGAIITSGEIQGELFQGRFGNMAPGNYQIVVYYDKKTYNFPVTKL